MYSFKSISVYFDKYYNLIGVPSTIDEKWKVIRDINRVLRLNVPYDNSQIEAFLLEVFDLCYSQPTSELDRYAGLQAYLGVRSHNAAVKNRGMVRITWSLTKGYIVTPT